MDFSEIKAQSRTFNLVDLVANYVRSKFKELPVGYHFHNIEHTKNVVNAVLEITQHETLGANDKEILIVSAWFHDIGHLISSANHEKHSIKLAQDFLQNINYPKHNMDKVKSCISATEYNKKPESNLGKIICDADLYHLSQSDYMIWLKRLRNELRVRHDMSFDEIEWVNFNINFLQQHKYLSDYGKDVLEKGKKKNIVQLQVIKKKITEMVPQKVPAELSNERKYLSHLSLTPLIILMVVCGSWFFLGLDQVFYNVLYFFINDLSQADKNIFETVFILGIVVIAVIQTIWETERNIK